jgi:hypothetical protein
VAGRARSGLPACVPSMYESCRSCSCVTPAVFGFAAALFERIPLVGLVFSISNRIGAAMWAHDVRPMSLLCEMTTADPLTLPASSRNANTHSDPASSSRPRSTRARRPPSPHSSGRPTSPTRCCAGLAAFLRRKGRSRLRETGARLAESRPHRRRCLQGTCSVSVAMRYCILIQEARAKRLFRRSLREAPALGPSA